MSHDEHLRQRTQTAHVNNPNLQKVESHQGNDHDRSVINNEIDRLNREAEERRRK